MSTSSSKGQGPPAAPPSRSASGSQAYPSMRAPSSTTVPGRALGTINAVTTNATPTVQTPPPATTSWRAPVTTTAVSQVTSSDKLAAAPPPRRPFKRPITLPRPNSIAPPPPSTKPNRSID
jgi:hypothetical protein